MKQYNIFYFSFFITYYKNIGYIKVKINTPKLIKLILNISESRKYFNTPHNILHTIPNNKPLQ